MKRTNRPCSFSFHKRRSANRTLRPISRSCDLPLPLPLSPSPYPSARLPRHESPVESLVGLGIVIAGAHSLVEAHPMHNEATIAVTPADLLRFLHSVNHDPVIICAPEGSAANTGYVAFWILLREQNCAALNLIMGWLCTGPLVGAAAAAAARPRQRDRLHGITAADRSLPNSQWTRWLSPLLRNISHD